MKDALVFLRSRLTRTSDALKRKIFDLTTTTASDEARKKRAGEKQTRFSYSAVICVETIMYVSIVIFFFSPSAIFSH